MPDTIHQQDGWESLQVAKMCSITDSAHSCTEPLQGPFSAEALSAFEGEPQLFCHHLTALS